MLSGCVEMSAQGAELTEKVRREFKLNLHNRKTWGQMCLISYYILTQLNYIYLTQFNYIPSLTSKRIFNPESRGAKFI